MHQIKVRLIFAIFQHVTTLITCSENMGYYWETKSFKEGDYEISFHFRKLFTREFTRIKSMAGFDPNEVARLCLSNGGRPPSISDLDKSAALREFLTLDVFQPYLVSNKYPAHHGFYLSSRPGSKAALWILRGGMYRVDFWQKPSNKEADNFSVPPNPLEIGIPSQINFANGERQHPDDVVCMVRRLAVTAAPRLATQFTTPLAIPLIRQNSESLVRCLSSHTLVEYNNVLSLLESSTGTVTRNSSHAIRGKVARTSSQLSPFDWFLIRHRFWLMATAIFSLGVLCLMLTLVACVWFALRRKEDKVERGVTSPSKMTCNEKNDSSATEFLLDSTSCCGEVVKRPKVVHVPNSQTEYGAIAARRHRDHTRRSIANMIDCQAQSPFVSSYTLKPKFSNRPAVVTDCGESGSVFYSDEDEQRFSSSTFRVHNNPLHQNHQMMSCSTSDHLQPDPTI